MNLSIEPHNTLDLVSVGLAKLSDHNKESQKIEQVLRAIHVGIDISPQVQDSQSNCI